MSGIAERLLGAIDWAAFSASPPQADTLARAVGELIGAENPETAERAWWGIENTAFSQDTVYELAVPTTDVMLAALVDQRPEFVREWIVEVLYFITSGGSADNPAIPGRCRDRARLGLWLLAKEAKARNGPARRRVLDVIDSVDESFGAVLVGTLEVES